MKKLLALLLAACMLFAFGACSKTDPAPGTTAPQTDAPSTEAPAGQGPSELRFGQFAMKAPLDRTVGTYLETGQVTEWLYEGMYAIDYRTNEYVPMLAESYNASDDGLTHTFKLRQGVKFHDGTDFTAEDVIFSYTRALLPATNSLVGEDLEMVVGARDVMDGKTDTLAGMTAPDDYTIVVTINAPSPLFLPFVGMLPIYPKEACSKAGAEWGNNLDAIGTGPYKLVSNNPEAEVVVEKNTEYWGGQEVVKVDKVIYKLYGDLTTLLLAYEKGDIDSTILDATQVAEYQEKLPAELKSFGTFGHFFTMMNESMAPFDNIKVREAFGYAIDVEAICNDLLGGTMEPASCLLAPTVNGHVKGEVKKYDPEKAKALLTEAGFPDGVEIEATTTNLSGTGGQMIVAMQAQAAAAGFKITPVQVDRATWTDIRNGGKVQFAIGNWYLGIPDPDGILYGFFHSTNNHFFSVLYQSEAYDKLMADSRLELDPDKRLEMLKKADQMLVSEDFVTVPIGWPKTFYLAKPYLQNFEMQNYVLPLFDCTVDMSAK